MKKIERIVYVVVNPGDGEFWADVLPLAIFEKERKRATQRFG